MSQINDELRAIFAAEVAEQLEEFREQLGREPAAWDLETLFRISHNLKGAAAIVDAAPLGEVAHAMEDLFSLVRDGGLMTPTVADLTFAGVELLQQCFGEPDTDWSAEIRGYRERVDAYCERAADTDPDADAVAAMAEVEPGSGEVAQDDDGPVGRSVRVRSDRAAGEAESGDARHGADQETLRIAVHKLERLMDLAAELQAAKYAMAEERELAGLLRADLTGIERRAPSLARVDGFRDVVKRSYELRRTLNQNATRFEQISEQIQDSVRLLRLVPLRSAQGLLRKVVRDASADTGKGAEFQIEGADTELDRVILARLQDPLVHLLRNAVVHGIEPPEERAGLGKSAAGVIELRARSSGTWVDLTITDDGRGIDVEGVRRAAVQRGIVGAERAGELSEAETLDLIFHSGVTTAEQLSDLAGRGVGMDVVRQNLAAIGGTIAVRTRPGLGTEFQLRVPLTRLTTRGILFRIGAQLFAVPVGTIERTATWELARSHVADGQEVIALDDQIVPLLDLAEALGLPASGRAFAPVIVLGRAERRRACIVDEILGETDFIIQPLPWNLQRLPGIAGCTVISGGDTILILDADHIIGVAQKSGGRTRVDTSTDTSSVRRRRILVADDSFTSRTLQKNILGSAGYEVLTAVDGEDAWTTLEGGGIDLVISDVDMPNLSGIDLTRRVRSRDEYADLPVILVTSLGNEEDRQRGSEAGADEYIVKGAFDQDTLLEAVARLL